MHDTLHHACPLRILSRYEPQLRFVGRARAGRIRLPPSLQHRDAHSSLPFIAGHCTRCGIIWSDRATYAPVAAPAIPSLRQRHACGRRFYARSALPPRLGPRPQPSPPRNYLNAMSAQCRPAHNRGALPRGAMRARPHTAVFLNSARRTNLGIFCYAKIDCKSRKSLSLPLSHPE